MVKMPWERGVYLGEEGGGGGTGAAVVDAPVEDTPEADGADTAGDKAPETDGEVEPEEVSGDEPAPSEDPRASRTYTDSDMAKMRRSLEAGFEKKLLKHTAELRQSLTGEVLNVRKEVDALKPPAKDPLDLWTESLPNGDESALEGTKAWQEANFKKDAQAVAPLMKQMRPALLPEVNEIKAVAVGLLQSFDKLRFFSEELTDFAKQVSEAMATGDPEAMKKVKMPRGIAHLDKVEAARKDIHEKSGGRVVPTYRGSFEQILKTVEQEEASAMGKEKKIREDERTRTRQETEQRKTAAGAPGNAAPSPRGAHALKPGTRRFEDIEKGIRDGTTEFVIP